VKEQGQGKKYSSKEKQKRIKPLCNESYLTLTATIHTSKGKKKPRADGNVRKHCLEGKALDYKQERRQKVVWTGEPKMHCL